MMRAILTMAVAAMAAAAPLSPSAAIPYMFTVFDPTSGFDGDSYTFSFDSMPTPNQADLSDTQFSLTGSYYYRLSSSTGSFSDEHTDGDFTFYTAVTGQAFSGGLSTQPSNSYFGPQLFSGPTSAPTFLTGSFDLNDGAFITIQPAAATVPEPATWAMLIAGFAFVGGALRLRRRERVFA